MKEMRLSILAGVLLACLYVVAHAPAVAADDKLVNINTASPAELSDLKGIGDAKAKVIVAYREKNGPFKTVDDLRQVNGIGDKLLTKLRPFVTVGPGAPPAAAAAAAKH